MGWKCTPQLTGLVRGEPKAGQKHRSNAERIIAEAGKERVSKSDTLDKDRSYLNRYTGFESGYDCLNYITKEADEYRQEVAGKGGTKHYRKLREDAIIGYAIIYNPPEEICSSWTDEEYTKFYEDSRDVMEQICPDIFRRDTIVMSAEHHDEGTITDPSKISRHIHDIGIPKSKDGRYCGTKIDAKLCADINKSYPKLMREKGWDIDDLDCTDWDKYNSDEEYRAERKSKQKSGKSVNEYLANKMRQQIKENEELSETLKNAISEALELAEDKDKLEQEKEQIECEKERLRVEREEIYKQRGDLFRAKIAQEKKEKEFQHKEDALDAQKTALEQDRKTFEVEKKKYKLGLMSTFDEKYRKYKADCEERVQDVADFASKLPPMSEMVEKVLNGAFVQESGKSYKTPAMQYLKKVQSIRHNSIRDYGRLPDFDFESEKKNDDFGMDF